MSQPKPRVTQADITRALRAAKKVGVKVAVEILPDGTVRLVPVSDSLKIVQIERFTNEPSPFRDQDRPTL